MFEFQEPAGGPGDGNDGGGNGPPHDQVVPVSDGDSEPEPLGDEEPAHSPDPPPLEEPDDVDPMEIASQVMAEPAEETGETEELEEQKDFEAKKAQLARGKSHIFHQADPWDSEILQDSQGSPGRFELVAGEEEFTAEDKKLPFEPVAADEPETEDKIAQMETELKRLRVEKLQLEASKRLKMESAFPDVVQVDESLPFGTDSAETVQMPEGVMENLMERFNNASLEVEQTPKPPVATRWHLNFQGVWLKPTHFILCVICSNMPSFSLPSCFTPSLSPSITPPCTPSLKHLELSFLGPSPGAASCQEGC